VERLPARAATWAFVVGALAGSAFLSSPQARAAEPTTAAVSPGPSAPAGLGLRLLGDPDDPRSDPRARAYIVQTVSPGATVTRHLEVTNTTGSARDVHLYTAAASIADGAFDIGGTAQNALSTWTTLSASQLTVDDGTSSEVTVEIVVPDDAAGGEQYAVVWAEMRAPAASAGAAVAVANRVGIRAYVDVDGAAEDEAAFEIGAVTSRASADGPVMTAAVTNTGDVAVDITGAAQLADGPGSTSAGPFPTSGQTSLAPGQDSTVSIPLPPDLSAGPWTATVTLASGSVTRTAVATLTLAADAPTESRSPGPWPWVLVAGLAALATALGAVFRRGRRRQADGPSPSMH
jgi:hypothetical protein